MKILVLEACALHLGFVGCYGNDWVATPNLDRLAVEGVVFDQHITDSPEPTTSDWRMRSAVTGRYAFPGARHGVTIADGIIRHEPIAALPRFAQQARRMTQQCVEPILWIDGPSLAPPWRLPADMLTVYTGDEAAPVSEPCCGVRSLEPEELDRLQSTYAAVVTYFDAQVGRLVDELRDTGQLDELLICVTARCGMPLGEHNLVGTERPWLHDEYVHVPLIVRFPHAETAGVRIPTLTQSIDLMPTLQAHLGLTEPAPEGQSLWPLIRGEVEQIRQYAVSALRMGGGEEWLLRTPERALVLPIQVPDGDRPRQCQLYVKPDDRWEANDLSSRHEEEAEQLRQTLRAIVGPMVS
jgi:arylsulfatase A-like enzyme